MTKSFKKPRKHQLRQLAKQVISFMLIASLLFGLIPEGVYASNNVKSVTNEKTFKSKECNITYVEDSTWGNYVNATIRIENQGSQDIEDWKISFDYDGTIDNIWNADILSCENGHYIIGAKSYNQKIAKGQTISFGMIAYGKNQKPTMPSKITLGEEEKEEEQPTEIEDSSLPKQYQALSYAVLSGGNNNFSLATNETYIGGNVHSNGGFTYQGTKLTIEGILETVSNIEIRTSSGTDCEKVEKKQENTASLSIPDLSKGIKEKLKEEGKVYQASKDFGQDTIVIDHSMWVNGNLNFNGTSFLGEGIVAAKDSIQYNVNSLKTGADARIFLMSQEGNITLNGSDITMNAVLYAPNGCVTVNANQFHLNGRIIAKEIRIHGTNIRIMSGKSDLSMIEFLWKPDLSIETSGFHKVNRKVVLELQGAENTDLTEEMVQWEITSAQEKKDTYSVDTTASNGLHQELLFHEAGTYEVTATVTNKGEKQQVTTQLNIEPDLAPVANFEIKETSVVRDEQKNATISMIDLSASPDGDEIKQRIWTIYYDENNNGKFEQEEATIVSDKNEKNFTYTTKKVGRYQVALEVVEEIKDTIPSLLKDTDYLRDNTLEKESGNTFFVDNKAPTSNLSIEKKRSADLVFTVGDVNKEGLAKYNEKAKEIKEALEKQGVDVRVETVSSSTLTAKDTFAWKEYGHTNYDDNNEGNHIRYEENNIRMVGYESRPVKDFLYVADNDTGQKIFTFDLQRDQTDWHSMEGGGFLFNTTIDEEKNTIRGFCILVTYEGLKLVQIDCNNLSGFRDGYYEIVQHAGKLLRTYPLANLYDNHHFTIIVDGKSISVLDGDKMIIDHFVLPKMDSSYGYGPITSHASHYCWQRSYFTFKNITMETRTGSSLSDIVAGYDWRPGSAHYVIHYSDAAVPELSTVENQADLASTLISNETPFIGIGNQENETQYSSLLALSGTGGLLLHEKDVTTAMEEISEYLTNNILAIDTEIKDYITTDMIVNYLGYFQDPEGDPLYEGQWEYEYDPHIFTEEAGKGQLITRKESEPITTFTDIGAYAIRFKVRDNPVGENDDLDEYRKWSDTKEYERLLLVQTRPTAKVQTKVVKNPNDKNSVLATVTYESEDADHRNDSKKGIRKEYFYYKSSKDSDWTEGKLPNKLPIGETFLVKYVAKDVEGSYSFPAVAVIKTSDFITYEKEEDTNPPKVLLSASKQTVKLGETVRIEGYATDDLGVNDFTLSIDGETVLETIGAVNYTATKEGEVVVKAVATDIGGNKAEETLILTVVDDRDKTAPTAMITSPDTGAHVGFNIQLKGTVKDETSLKGYTLSYRKVGESDYHTFATGEDQKEEEVLGTLDVSGLSEGEYEVLLTVEDEAGNLSYCGLVIEIEMKKTEEPEQPEQPEQPQKEYALVLSHTMALTGTTVWAQVTLPDTVSKETLTIMVDDKVIATGETLTSFVVDKPGRVVVTATATDKDGVEYKKEASLICYNKDDKTPPTIALITPKKDSVLTVPTEIVGTAYDEEGDVTYKLEYRMEGDTDYELLVEGEGSKKEEVLGTLDTTMLQNGRYELRLTVIDQGGNRVSLVRTITVEGNLKVGAIHLGFTDLTEKMAGATLTLNRIYDNRDKTKGDFGYGWNLGIDNMKLYETNSLAEGYEMVRSGSVFSTTYEMKETINHDIVVAYGDGTSDRFKVIFNPARSALTPIRETSIALTCVTNPKVKLEILEDTTALVSGGEVYFINDVMYDTLSYRLTTEEGNQIYLRKDIGVYQLEDANGNVIKVDKNGYHASNGKSIIFTRDEGNRITAITDTTGKTIQYAYDETGNLSSVTDRANRKVTFTYDNDHNLLSIIDPMGVAVSRNEYDDAGRLIATIDAEGNRTEYEHDVEGRTEIITDRLGNKTLYVYDDSGNVLSTTDANGNTTKSTYDSVGNVLTKEDAKGNVTSYTYDANGNMTTVTDANGNSVKNIYNDGNHLVSMKGINDTEILIDYDKKGHITATTDAEGNTTTYDKDKNGNVTGIADEIGKVMSAKYDQDGNVIETEDSAGNKTINTYDEAGNRLTQTTYAVTEEGTVERTTRFVYNDAGELVQTIDADGNATSVERNESGKMSAAVDSKGRRTEYRYDSYGNVNEILYSDGTCETYEYDAEGRNIKSTNRLGLTVHYTYDKVGNLLKQTDARGNSTLYTYDKNYNLLTVTSPTGAMITYTYDNLNRNTAIEDNEGNVTRFTYDEMSLHTSTTDAKGNVTKYEYDKNGNRTKVIYADGATLETNYDERGRIQWQKDAEGRKITYTYDSSDRLINVTQNNGAVTTYTYDQVGNLTSVTDDNGNTTTYVYDENTRRIKTILPDGKESACKYDKYGMLLSTTDYNGNVSTYTYDKEDRIVKETTGEAFTEYTYDQLGRITNVKTKDSHITYGYNNYGILSVKSYENGQKISYGYDVYGRMEEIKVSQDDTTISSTKYEYDTMNRLTRVMGHDGTAVVYTYDENGNRETATFANGVVLTYTYDECNRLIMEKVVDKDENLIAQYEYTLGKGGERTKVKETGLGETVTTSYEYDEAGRLTQEIITKGEDKTTYGYVYDKVGNRTEKWEKGTATKYTYNSRNQLIKEETLEGTVVYSYDANGNLLNQAGNGKAISYQYDEYNRLIQYSEGEKKETYTYDAEGVRRTKENGTKTIYYVSDTTGSLSYTLAETDEVGETLAAYTRADTLISQIRGEESSYYLYDGHGDVRGLLDTEGTITDTYRYNAYGELLEQTGNTENHYRYTGEYYDSTSNLYYLRARYMNPSTGTFISMDSYQGSIYDPDTLHKYLYANGNPVKYSDPSGNFFAAASVMISSTMNTLASNSNTLHLMGLVSGISNAAITSFLGGSDKEVEKAFIKGYIMGVGLGALHIVVAAYSVIAFASLMLVEASISTIITLIMVVCSIANHKEKETIVYSVLAILSLIGLCQAYNYYCKVVIEGDKGCVIVDIDESEADGITVDVETSYGKSSEKIGDFTDLEGSTVDEILDRIPNEAVLRELYPVQGGATEGFEFKWVQDGQTYRVRVHNADPSAPVGTNAYNGWVVRVQRGRRYFDPTINDFREAKYFNPNGPDFDEVIVNDTHIPIMNPYQN